MNIDVKQLSIYFGLIVAPLMLLGVFGLKLMASHSSDVSMPPTLAQELPTSSPPASIASAVPVLPKIQSNAAEPNVDRAATNPRAVEPKPIEKNAALQVAQMTILVRPWGEVYLDGKMQGVSPPLDKLKVAPGKHTVEIRNTTFPAYTQTLQVKAGEEIKLQHKFAK